MGTNIKNINRINRINSLPELDFLKQTIRKYLNHYDSKYVQYQKYY